MVDIGRFFQDPGGHYFLFGPRGTGKSTLLRHMFPDSLRLDLLSPDVERRYSARPERLRDLLGANPGADVVVIDEIQRVPALLNVIHQLVEESPKPRFIMTGSSARKLRRGGANLPAGRAALRALHPFFAAELKDEFDLGRALRLGLLPLVWRAERPEEAQGAYVSLYLKEEVQAEGLIRSAGSFARFLEAVSFWRTKSGYEVDFVVYGPRGIWAIEVKHASEVRRKVLRSLLAFREDYPESKARLVYRGSEKLQIDGILCLPCEPFLKGIVPGEDLP